MTAASATRASLPGRDRRAVRHEPAPPFAVAPDERHVVVAGGGIAGLAAATGLAERGIRVTLLEREPRLGGRVAAWPLDDARTMSRGFHAFFRQYYNLRTLLRRADPGLRRLVPLADYPLLGADGTRDSFARIPRTPPWNFAAFVLRSETFRPRDLPAVDVRAALEMLAVDFPATFAAYDGQSAADFLDRLNFPRAARHLALEVFARSFFAAPEEFSAGELVAMFHTYFLGSAEGLLFDVPDDDYDTALWAPLGRHLAGLGVSVECDSTVGALDTSGDGVVVRASSGEYRADAAVLALDPASLRQVVAASPALGDVGDGSWRERIGTIRTAPPFGVLRLWLDRPARAERPGFLGTTGFGGLDNISVLERFESGARDWARVHNGSVVELHAYALAGSGGNGVRERLRADLDRVYPEFADATELAGEWLVRDDCWLTDTRPWQERVGVATPDPRVVLAGDGVRCELPVALMERAATTGLLAANELLRQWGRPGHALWTVPMTGRHAVVRRFARPAGQPRARNS